MRQIAAFDILDPGLRAGLDAVARRSATLLRTPIALVTLVLDSAQLVLGSHGLGGWIAEAQGTPAEWAMCTYTVLTGEPYQVTDSDADPRHADSPFMRTTGMRSYLGVPLIVAGQALGAHCAVDPHSRAFGDGDLAVLNDGAAATIRLLWEHRHR
ncbi:GAF domain-containing protein [Actinoplanes sp. NPDC049802]|uniref:GAF domain-containing protein n=1 Tax=Actinoplanes sp. NPDC049802 TaxID=3154742 RepID=UPI00340A90C1